MQSTIHFFQSLTLQNQVRGVWTQQPEHGPGLGELRHGDGGLEGAQEAALHLGDLRDRGARCSRHHRRHHSEQARTL